MFQKQKDARKCNHGQDRRIYIKAPKAVATRIGTSASKEVRGGWGIAAPDVVVA